MDPISGQDLGSYPTLEPLTEESAAGPVSGAGATQGAAGTAVPESTPDGPGNEGVHPRVADERLRGQIVQSHIQELLPAGQGGSGGPDDIAPTGVHYRLRSEPVPGSTCIFQQRGHAETGIDPHIYSVLSQYDNSRQTISDPTRCGATSAIVSAMNQDGPDGLINLIGATRTRLSGELDMPAFPGASQSTGQELDRIEQAVRNGDATVADLGRLEDLEWRGFHHGVMERTGAGISEVGEGRLYDRAHLQTPQFDSTGNPSFEPGQSWPFLLDTNHDGRGNHWVTFGQEQGPPIGQGRQFVYDPLPTADGGPHIHYEGSPAFNQYLQAAHDQQQAGSGGWAPPPPPSPTPH